MSDPSDDTRDSITGRVERAKDRALGAHDAAPSRSDELAEAAGGISGVLVGAGIGSAAGPVGTVLGGIAGAIGGWWTGRAVAEAASTLSHEDDEHFRAHFDRQPGRPVDRAYDDVRAAYYLGHIASHDPAFVSRPFDQVEPELERAWNIAGAENASWKSVRAYAAEGFIRGRARRDDPARREQANQEARTKNERADGRA